MAAKTQRTVIALAAAAAALALPAASLAQTDKERELEARVTELEKIVKQLLAEKQAAGAAPAAAAVVADRLDGPDVALSAAGLPLPGSSLAIGNTINQWAFYNQKGSAKRVSVQDSAKLWDVTTVFSTRPAKTCLDTRWGDPLLQPHRVRGNFNRVMKEAIYDRNGAVIQNTIGERFKGPETQFPRAYPIVELEMNVAWINLAWMAKYADSVNSNVQWGQPVRTIKCTVGPWETSALRDRCYYYFVVHFTFELNTIWLIPAAALGPEGPGAPRGGERPG